jgi:integrase
MALDWHWSGTDLREAPLRRSFRKARITATVVQDLAPGETVMDTEEPGFGVRRQGAARVFFVRKHARGLRHFETLGECGTGGLTVTSARERAKRMVVALREGHSPAERRIREHTMPTLAQLADDWLSHHVSVKLKPKSAADYRSSLRIHILPTLGKLRVDLLTQDHAARLHQTLRNTPYAANRTLAVLSKMMSYAERKGYREQGSNPIRGLERYREEQRERFLNLEELGRLGSALRDPGLQKRHSQFALTAIALLLLTGARLREVLHLKWPEVDLQRGMLLLLDSKTGRKAIILGDPAARLLADVPRTGSEWVFPGLKPDQPMYDLHKSWAGVRRVAGLTGIRLHDLRHTFASYSAGAGGSLPMIGHLLGHSQPATTARYAHLAASPVRALADRSSGVIAAALGPGALIIEPRDGDDV